MSYDLLQLCFWEFGSAGTEIVIRIVTKIDLPGYIKSDISSTSGWSQRVDAEMRSFPV